jgi:hypothetical protein
MAFLPISLASFVFRTEWVKGSRRFFFGSYQYLGFVYTRALG